MDFAACMARFLVPMRSSGRAAAVVSASRCRPRPRTVERPCFHLSIPAIDLQRSHDWYVGTLGCRPGRRSDQAAILDFEGHQLVLQSTPGLQELPQVGIYPRHFGLVFATLGRWEQLRDQLVAQRCPFAVTPKCRYAGGPLEHHLLCARPQRELAGVQALQRWRGGVGPHRSGPSRRPGPALTAIAHSQSERSWTQWV